MERTVDNDAVEYALLVIESYESEIRNAANNFGVDLEGLGFCQGRVFKNARARIEKLRAQSEGTVPIPV